MAKKPQQDFMAESLLLRFLSAPVRWLKILCLAVLILFGSSILLQSYFHQNDLLEQELTATVRMGSRSLWQQWAQPDGRNTESSGTGFNLTVSRTVYQALSTVLYDWIPINYLLSTEADDPGYTAKERFLEPNRRHLERFDQALRIISLRLGNAVFFAMFALYLAVPALTDGFIQRRIRQENASRESAGIYHRAKYWRTGILSAGLLAYLSWPIATSPLWLMLPVGVLEAMIYLQAKFLKKYL